MVLVLLPPFDLTNRDSLSARLLFHVEAAIAGVVIVYFGVRLFDLLIIGALHPFDFLEHVQPPWVAFCIFGACLLISLAPTFLLKSRALLTSIILFGIFCIAGMFLAVHFLYLLEFPLVVVETGAYPFVVTIAAHLALRFMALINYPLQISSNE